MFASGPRWNYANALGENVKAGRDEVCLPGHAYNARILLARIAGIDAARAQKLAFADNADAIINALGPQP